MNLITLLLAFSFTISNLSGFENRTMGGEFVPKSDTSYPWIDTVMNGCTGSLISDTFVLTAFHCVTIEPDNPAMYIQSATANKTSSMKNIYHPDGASLESGQDIALVELSSPIALLEYATIPNDKFINDYYGKKDASILLGIGVNDIDDSFGNLTQLTLSILDRNSCSSKIKSQKSEIADPESFICDNALADKESRGKPIGMCAGDSGGALVIKTENGHTQIGVTSGYLEDGGNIECGYNTGIYANVSYYSSWIKSVLSGKEKPKEVDTIKPEDIPMRRFYGHIKSMPKSTWSLISPGMDMGGRKLSISADDLSGLDYNIYIYKNDKFKSYDQTSTEIITLDTYEAFWIYINNFIVQ